MESAGLPEGYRGSQESREAVLDTWWSRYCTTCGARRPFPESVCPHDGSALRDLSVSWDSYFESLVHLGSGFDDTIDAPSLQEEQPREQDHRPLPPVLGGKWKISQRKGGGSFGSFYAGQHSILGMPVGIKLLRRRFAAGSTGRKLFHEEALRVSRLDHPNIVKVFDYGEEDNRPYLIMEYLTGKPLNRFLEEGGLSLEEGVEVIRQAATALMAIVKASPGLRFETEEAFLGWAHEIVEHRIARAARYWKAARRRAEREVSLRTGKGDADPRSERPSQVLARKERTARISDAIASLPKQYREVVISRLLLNLPWAAVASSLGTTESAAQMRLTRARRRLAALLRSSRGKP